jgi:hypothetical protein
LRKTRDGLPKTDLGDYRTASGNERDRNSTNKMTEQTYRRVHSKSRFQLEFLSRSLPLAVL